MADLTITAANVLPGSNAAIDRGHVAGAAVTAGQTVYLDPTVGKWLLADSNSATAAARTPKGIALNGAALNQPLAVQTGGDITAGATLVAGVAYYQSDTPGGICPVADVGTGEYVSLLGLAKSTTVLGLDIESSGTAN